MNNKFINLFFAIISVVNSYSQNTAGKVIANKPNIIYILADDLGYGDLSCYGQKKFKTPNIDKLALKGMLFTQHYSGSTVCAPSRSALLTGMNTGHTVVRGNKEMKPEGQYPIPDNTYTLAEAMKNAGYATGAFGKWGLGFPGSEGDPNNQGFDTFFGYNCQRLGHNYYPYHLWDNQNKVILEGNSGTQKNEYAPDLIHQKALDFIDKNKEKPFFLYYPSIIPHAELAAPQNYIQKYIGKFEPEKPFIGYDKGPLYRDGNYESQQYPHAAFAAMINLLDVQVGEIMKKIKDLGLENNTIIIFTSDNGPHQEGGADPDYFNSNGGLRGYKRDLFEGGIRVPMIVKWKEKITPGRKTDHISAFWDVFPTFADITQSKKPENIDGISFLPTLLGKGNQVKHNYLYWEFHELGGRQAIRKDNWKLIKYNVNKGGKYQLYNLDTDPSEKEDLSNALPEKVKELSKILESSRTESENFNFN